MSVLGWDKPAKVLTTEEWKSISADSAPPGVYVPNMSVDDMERWKAKMVGHGKVRKPKCFYCGSSRGARPDLTIPGVQVCSSCWSPWKPLGKRVEIRKSAESGGVQILLVVTEEDVRISMNGTARLSQREIAEMSQAISEAQEALKK